MPKTLRRLWAASLHRVCGTSWQSLRSDRLGVANFGILIKYHQRFIRTHKYHQSTPIDCRKTSLSVKVIAAAGEDFSALTAQPL